MRMKEALLIVLSRMDKPMRQCDIVTEIYKLTGSRYSKDSILGNVFRNTKNYPWLFSQISKIKEGTKTYWRKQPSVFKHTFNKPEEYFKSLLLLNDSNKIYTLCGTESNCLKSLDNSKTTTVDFSPLVKADIKGNIFKIKKYPNSSYNLDFEGIFSKRKMEQINELDADKILLTFKSSKNDKYISKLYYKYSLQCEYKRGNSLMKIYLLKQKSPITTK